MIIQSDFNAPWWAKNRHVQTIWPRFLIKKPKLDIEWEKLTLPDGDFVELAWHKKNQNPKGLVVVFHGLEGSIDSHYAAHLINEVSTEGWDAVLVHFRGCGPQGNQTARSYHSGETLDNLVALNHIGATMQYRQLVAVGYSLGGNMLLKMLGEDYNGPKLSQAIAVSPPFDLAKCSEAISQGFSRVYEKHLLKSMCNKFLGKYSQYDYQSVLDITESEINGLDTFFAFDDKITGPLHGFKGAKHYYDTCSARHFMKDIKTPTLVLHAKDDPFMTEDIVPGEATLSEQVTIELSDKGGHVGFMSGSPLKPRLWINQRIAKCLENLKE